MYRLPKMGSETVMTRALKVRPRSGCRAQPLQIASQPLRWAAAAMSRRQPLRATASVEGIVTSQAPMSCWLRHWPGGRHEIELATQTLPRRPLVSQARRACYKALRYSACDRDVSGLVAQFCPLRAGNENGARIGFTDLHVRRN